MTSTRETQSGLSVIYTKTSATACDAYDLVMDTDRQLILEKRGPSFDLWGAYPGCRRRGCPGRVTFYISAPEAMAAIAMTAKSVR